MLLISVARKVTICIITFLKRTISGFVCSRIRGALRSFRRRFSFLASRGNLQACLLRKVLSQYIDRV